MNRHLPAIKVTKGAKVVVPKYPSPYGSHAKMVNEELTEKLPKDEQEGFVVCTDDYGDYKTEKWRLDCGLADPNRNAYNRLKGVKKEKEK